MTPLKTIIATAVIAVGGTVAAFSGLHIGQTNADAAAANQAVKAKTTYTVTLSAKQLAKLMHGQTGATQQVKHHQRQAKRHAVRYQNNGSSSRSYSGSHSYNGSSGSYGSRSSSGQSGYRSYGSGSHSGSWGGGSHSGGGGCW